MDGSEMMAGHERRRATDHMMIPWLQQHIPWRVQVALILVSGLAERPLCRLLHGGLGDGSARRSPKRARRSCASRAR